MNTDNIFYLKEELFIDPLINNWTAWPYLLPPVQYSMYLVKTHTRLLNSFLNDHEFHIMANQDATLAGGGEFVDCNQSQLKDVQALLEKYKKENALYYEIHEAVIALDELLKNHPKGHSLEPLYAKIPKVLKGYVELIMDMNHNASFRLIEGLIYESELYQESLQSVSVGLLSRIDSRPFVLSTPRFEDDNYTHICEPFGSKFWDKLFSARENPISRSEIAALFDGITSKGGLSFETFFTKEPPSITYTKPSNARIKYTGHAGLLIEDGETCVMVDPVIASRDEKHFNEIFSFSELPPFIDCVCITHSHSDHINLETLLQLRYKIGKVLVPKNNGGSLADPSLKLMLKKLGFNVEEVDEFERIQFGGIQITSIPFLGEHGDLNIRTKSGWVFNIAGKTIYAAADSSNLDPKLYDLIHEQIGDLDILAIGMECVGAHYTWMYGALATQKISREIKESRRLNGTDCPKAAKMQKSFNAKMVLIYALGREPWFSYFMGLDYEENSEQLVQSKLMLEHCENIGIPAYCLENKWEIAL